MFNNILMQANGFLDVIWDWWTPFEVPQAALVIAAGIVGFLALKYWNHFKEPPYERVGICRFFMPHIGEYFQALTWSVGYGKRADELIATFEMVHKNNMDNFNRVAAVLEENKGMSYVYLLQYRDTEGSTRPSGWAAMVTNAPIDHHHYSTPLRAMRAILRGEPTKVLMLGQSQRQGFIDTQIGFWEETNVNKVVDHIFFPVDPIRGQELESPQFNFPALEYNEETDGPQQQVTTSKLELIKSNSLVRTEEIRASARIILHAVEKMNQTVMMLKKTKNLEIIAKAADERADKAETLVRRYSTQVNHERRQRLKKNYWSEQMSSTGSPLSMAIIILIVGGCAVFLPDVLSRNIPGYTMQHYIAISVAIGAVLVWVIGMFSDRRGSGVGGV